MCVWLEPWVLDTFWVSWVLASASFSLQSGSLLDDRCHAPAAMYEKRAATSPRTLFLDGPPAFDTNPLIGAACHTRVRPRMDNRTTRLLL